MNSNPASVLRPSLVKLELQWRAKVFMVHLLLARRSTTSLAAAQVAAVLTRATSSMSAMCALLELLATEQGPDERSFVQLPYQAGWQDLKDLFRSAGNIIRADINIGADGRPKGSGTVLFETASDAQNAISMSNVSSQDTFLTGLQKCTTASTGTVAYWKCAR